MTTTGHRLAHGVSTPRLGSAGKAAAALFGLHVLVLFLPPIPPLLKGSLWSYVLGYTAVILAAVELRAQSPALVRRCGGMGGRTRTLLGAGTAAWLIAMGLAVRWHTPDLFARWSREEGVWEPLTLLAFLAGASVLFGAARFRASDDRRQLQLFGAGYALLVLEEVDYFGIFGGIIGRVDGVYVGSPHDLIGLAVAGLLPLWGYVATVTFAAVLIGALVRSGYLQPGRVVGTLLARRGAWLVTYAVLVALAQVEDLSLFYLLGEPRLEELLELAGAVLLLAFAADVAADATRTAPLPDPAPADESRERAGPVEVGTTGYDRSDSWR